MIDLDNLIQLWRRLPRSQRVPVEFETDDRYLWGQVVSQWEIRLGPINSNPGDYASYPAYLWTHTSNPGDYASYPAYLWTHTAVRESPDGCWQVRSRVEYVHLIREQFECRVEQPSQVVLTVKNMLLACDAARRLGAPA